MRSGNRHPWSSLAIGVYLIAIYAFIFLPVIVLVVFSFQDGKLPVPPFRGFSLRWYDQLFDNARLMAGLVNSLIVAVSSAFAATLLGFLAAYGIARHRPFMANAMQWLLIAPLFVSYLVIGMGLLIALRELGISKSLFTVMIGHLVINLPLAFAVIYGQMGEHQVNLERAARDLGAREWQVLLRITVPILWPALFAAFALTFTFSWDEFIIAFLLSFFEVTLPVELWSMLRRGLNPQANAAGSLVFGISMGVLLLAVIVFSTRRQRTPDRAGGT